MSSARPRPSTDSSVRPSGSFRIGSLLIVVAALGVMGALGYSYTTRGSDEPAAAVVAPPRTVTAPNASAPREPESQAPATSAPALFAATTTPETSTTTVERWIADTQSQSAQTRAETIAALARAPKAQAVPALQRVLETGEPELDRQIALRSLHALALEHGDEDGAIREVLRGAIYHGDDEAVSQSAQAVLDDIEADMAER